MNNNEIMMLTEYFKIIRPLIKYKYNIEIKDIYERVLKYVLNVFKRNDLYEKCNKLINKTLALQTIGDTLAANFDLIKDVEEKKVLEIKTKYILLDKITALESFHLETFINNLIKESNEGNVEACKLYAVLNNIGLCIEENISTSLLVNKMLAYNGDEFAMHSLIYTYSKIQKEEKKTKWEDIYKLYCTLKKNVIPVVLNKNTVNDRWFENDIINCVQIIFCIESRNQEKKSTNLDIPLLYYVIKSNDGYKDKIQNICSETNGYIILLNSQINQNRVYEF